MNRAGKALVAIAAVALACGAGVLVGNAVAGTRAPSSDTADSAPATAAKPTRAVKVVEAPRTIDDGTWRVGDEVKPGTYVVTVPDGVACYYARLRGFSGEFDEIISNGNGEPGQRLRITIAKTDKGFETHDCGLWKSAKT